MMGSVDNSLFQEKIKNFNSSVSDFSIRIPARMEPMMTSSFLRSSLGLEKKRMDPPFFLLLTPEPVNVFCFALYTLCSHSELGMNDLFFDVANSFALPLFPLS